MDYILEEFNKRYNGFSKKQLKLRVFELEYDNNILQKSLQSSRTFLYLSQDKLREDMYKETDLIMKVRNQEKLIRELERKLRPSLLKRLFKKLVCN